LEIAKVLRDLLVLKGDKELSFGERKMLDTARSLLVKELSIARAHPEKKMTGLYTPSPTFRCGRGQGEGSDPLQPMRPAHPVSSVQVFAGPRSACRASPACCEPHRPVRGNR